MSSTKTTPETARRGSVMTRGQAKKVEAATKENAHPAPRPMAGKKNAKLAATTSKPAKKRKSPSPELSDDTTLVDEPAEGPSPKKKKASPKASMKKEKPEVSGKATKGGEKTEKKDTTTPQPTPAASPSPIDHEAIAKHVKQAVHSAIMPFTKLLDPFMQFQMQCAKLGEETGLEADAKRTQVIDIIAELQARYAEDPTRALEDALDGDDAKMKTQEKSEQGEASEDGFDVEEGRNWSHEG